MEERSLDLVDQVGRTQAGMTAQFSFLESQYHWPLVQPLYILIMFCIVYRGIHHTVPYIIVNKQQVREHMYYVPQTSFSFSKIKKLGKSLFVARILFYRKVFIAFSVLHSY